MNLDCLRFVAKTPGCDVNVAKNYLKLHDKSHVLKSNVYVVQCDHIDKQ